MATIRNRSNRWQAIVKRKGYPTLTKTFSLRREAEKWARQQELLMDSGRWVDQSEAAQTTLKALLDRYAKEVSTTKRGSKAELNRIELLKKSSIAKYSLNAINGQIVAGWRDARLKAVSSGTVLRELCILSHVFTVAICEWGIGLHTNPVSLIRKPSPGKPRERVLDDTERQALIDSCAQCRNPWIKPVVIFALETSARRGEILALKWDDIDLHRKTAKLRVTKTNEPRTIPLSPACIAMLERLPRSIDGSVFPVTVEALKQAYERAVTRAGIKNFTFHDLRHDALTRLAKLGLSVLELRAISGHATANMLQRYVSINPSELALKLAQAV